MRVFAAVVGIAAFATLPSASVAEWQFTRWGMTPQQVMSASKGEMTRAPMVVHTTDGMDRLLQGKSTIGGTVYRLEMDFGHAGLSRIYIHGFPATDNCDGLRSDLTGKFGDHVAGDRDVWLDRTKGNRIEIFDETPTECNLIYTPITSGSAAAL